MRYSGDLQHNVRHILTAPVSAHALARSAHISGIKLCKESVVDRYEEDEDKKT